MRTTQLLLTGAAPTRIHLFHKTKPPNHNINQEHAMDWIIWLIVLVVVAAVVGGIIALIILGIRHLVRKLNEPRNGTP